MSETRMGPLKRQRVFLEIFNNPNDIWIFVGKNGEQYRIRVGRSSRGQEPKVLIDPRNSSILSREGAVQTVEKFLRAVRHAGIEYYRHDDGFDHTKALDPELISQIINELRQNPETQEVWTNELVTPLFKNLAPTS